MIQFTLYCFSVVFKLPYSGTPKNDVKPHLFNLFNTENRAPALTKVVYGEASGSGWVHTIYMNATVCKTIRDDIIRYVYRKVIKKPVNNIDKNDILQELLEFALTLDLDIQKQIYTNRGTDEVKKYIESMQKMEESQFTSDDIFLKEQKHDTGSSNETETTHIVGQNIAQNKESFHILLQNAYECLTAYREAVREANVNTIESATEKMQTILQNIYLYYEKNQFLKPKKAQSAKNIVDIFNRYTKLFNQFIGYSSGNRMSSEAQQYALLAENEFNTLLQLIINLLSEHNLPNSAVDFLENNLDNLKVTDIDFAFHAGREWLNNDNRIRLLDRLRKQKINCRIIINDDSEATELMIKNMGHPDRPYTPIIQNVYNWYQYQKKYPIFKVKISPLPLLHCYYHIKTQQPEDGTMRLHYYTYKNTYIRENYAQIFNVTSPYYHLYEEEFDYLWQLSEDINKYFSKK